jgi:hypothetical protein
MADLTIKPQAGSGNKVIIQDQAGGAVITTADSGATLGNSTQDNITRLGTVASGTFEGTLNSATTFSGDAGQRTAKAWAFFDGTGTPSFYDSYNCSTITDGGTGIYSVNYTSNLGSADYAAVASAGKADDGPMGYENQFVITNHNGNSTVALCEVLSIMLPYSVLQDGLYISLTVFGD